MGKRSSFTRVERDFYPTPAIAVEPLVGLLPSRDFIEPCVGDGALVRALESRGMTCLWQSDIATGRDALTLTAEELPDAPIITNPPWARPVLHALIAHLSALRTTWLLFDADWPHTRQAADLMGWCHEIVPVGRLKWIPGSPHTGKDNCAWYRFERCHGRTVFHARRA